MESFCLEEEYESLSAIYLDELNIYKDRSTVEILLHPATAENIDQQYVCITLLMKIPSNYPFELPEMELKNPRGFSDEEIYSMKRDLKDKAEKTKGHPMLYELIELCKECLTASNVPSCECPICLYSFMDADVFMKTECYHYFHSYCLASYVEQQYPRLEQQLNFDSVKILCPVCRAEIDFNGPKEKDHYPQPVEALNESANASCADLTPNQRLFEAMYDKQKANGGIIDVEAEKNKFLLNISVKIPDVQSTTVSNECDSVLATTSDASATSKKEPPSKQSDVTKVREEKSFNKQHRNRRNDNNNRFKKHNRYTSPNHSKANGNTFVNHQLHEKVACVNRLHGDNSTSESSESRSHFNGNFKKNETPRAELSNGNSNRFKKNNYTNHRYGNATKSCNNYSTNNIHANDKGASMPQGRRPRKLDLINGQTNNENSSTVAQKETKGANFKNHNKFRKQPRDKPPNLNNNEKMSSVVTGIDSKSSGQQQKNVGDVLQRTLVDKMKNVSMNPKECQQRSSSNPRGPPPGFAPR